MPGVRARRAVLALTVGRPISAMHADTTGTQPSLPKRVFPLIRVYEDSLDNRWRGVAYGANANLDSPVDAAWHDRIGPDCSRSIQVTFDGPKQALVLHSDGHWHVHFENSAPLLLSFAFALPSGLHVPPCSDAPASDRCSGKGACIALQWAPKGSLQQRSCTGEPRPGCKYVPLCATVELQQADSRPAAKGAALPTYFQWAALPLSSFGVLTDFNELLVVSGRGVKATRPLVLHLDEVSVASPLPLATGGPMPFWRPDNATRTRLTPPRGWRREGVPDTASLTGDRLGLQCEYMNAETLPRRAPRCRMDGDHLVGRWVQTCEPHRIHRPDRFAYARALPQVKGRYDFRICYRVSGFERWRSQLALSWSWRPQLCTFEPVSGADFDRWLGRRTILWLGDSLMAQSFFSLVWLLGSSVEGQTDVELGPNCRVSSLERLEACESSVGVEGGWLSIVRLRSGGELIKVLRHAELFHELHNLGASCWSRYLLRADVVVLSIGHHYHRVDPAFAAYSRMAHVALKQMARYMKPTAHLVLRTTNIGNPACANATQPLSSRVEAWRQLSGSANLFEWRVSPRKLVHVWRDAYNWRGPALFEGAWAEAAARQPGLALRFSVLNVSFMDTRADGHVARAGRDSARGMRPPVDCLHYCLPGPSDYWALSLYNLLLNNPRYAGTKAQASATTRLGNGRNKSGAGRLRFRRGDLRAAAARCTLRSTRFSGAA